MSKGSLLWIPCYNVMLLTRCQPRRKDECLGYVRRHYLAKPKCLLFLCPKVNTKKDMSLLALGKLSYSCVSKGWDLLQPSVGRN